MKSKWSSIFLLAVVSVAAYAATARSTPTAGPTRLANGAYFSASPVIQWSNEARRAIVPAGPGGIFGAENYGNKFPGEAAVYMGIVHAAIYDAAVAIEGGYEPYAIALTAPRDTSPAAAIATAAHHTLVGLQPALGLTVDQQAILDGDYAAYVAAIPDGAAKTTGIAVGERVASAVLALRMNDGREANPQLGQPPFVLPPPGPGVWQPNASGTVLGLRLPGIRPLALQSASQFRPDGPSPLTSTEYAEDFQQVKELGRFDSTARTQRQTRQALFWTDHDLRQWNDGMLRLAVQRDLDLVQTARMLAMAHISEGDAMIACFDAKFHYWFWRPYQAIPLAGTDGNPTTEPDPTWLPLRPTPNFPEYPSAHACHSGAMARALTAYFVTDDIAFTLDSRVTGTTRTYDRFREVVKDVNQARVLAGFHFRNSDQEGATLGREVARYVAERFFKPLG
jgi:PAP2 superfamily